MHTVNCNEIYFNNNSNINKTCSYIYTVCQVSEDTSSMERMVTWPVGTQSA